MSDAPLTQKWINGLKKKLEPRGKKAELAEFLAGRFGQTAREWQQRLRKLLAGTAGNPRTELYLAIQQWTESA